MAHTPLPACRHMQRSRAVSEVSPLAAFSKNSSPALSSLPEQEERHEERFPRQFEVRYRELTVTSDSLYAVFQGQIANMSTGGMCLATDRPLTPYATIRCEITLPGSPVGVPCLLQVRWVREVQQGVYMSGLLYLM
jgi:PilZ domain